MLELSLLSNLLKVSHCSSLLLIEKIVPVLMLLPGTFGVGIGSVRFLMSGCSTLLRAPISVSYQLHEREKRRAAYDARVIEVERACFSPLVFAATGGMGLTAITVLSKLAMLAEKRSINYIQQMLILAVLQTLFFIVKIICDVFKGSLLFNKMSCYNNYGSGRLHMMKLSDFGLLFFLNSVIAY